MRVGELVLQILQTTVERSVHHLCPPSLRGHLLSVSSQAAAIRCFVQTSRKSKWVNGAQRSCTVQAMMDLSVSAQHTWWLIMESDSILFYLVNLEATTYSELF